MNETQRRWTARKHLWIEAFDSIDLSGRSVLDAGTGQGYFTRFLAENGPAKLVSVTCVEEEIPPAKSVLGDVAGKVEFVIADLTSMTEFPDASFDVVGADFLIAALAAYSPYHEIECLRELRRVLRPGGRLVITGWEVWPDVRSELEMVIRRLFKLREAVSHLRGIDPFREHPRFWIENRLAELDMPAERSCVVPDVHYEFSWFVQNIEKGLGEVEPDDLRSALQRRLLEEQALLERHAATFAAGFEFGSLYAVAACKLEGAIVLQ